MNASALARHVAARELVVVALADHALAALDLALLAEHPTLGERHDPRPPPTLHLARELARRARRLRRELAAYRAAVEADIVPPPDDLPF